LFTRRSLMLTRTLGTDPPGPTDPAATTCARFREGRKERNSARCDAGVGRER
jgi:hypothetical protein